MDMGGKPTKKLISRKFKIRDQFFHIFSIIEGKQGAGKDGRVSNEMEEAVDLVNREKLLGP